MNVKKVIDKLKKNVSKCDRAALIVIFVTFSLFTV